MIPIHLFRTARKKIFSKKKRISDIISQNICGIDQSPLVTLNQRNTKPLQKLKITASTRNTKDQFVAALLDNRWTKQAYAKCFNPKATVRTTQENSKLSDHNTILTITRIVTKQ